MKYVNFKKELVCKSRDRSLEEIKRIAKEIFQSFGGNYLIVPFQNS